MSALRFISASLGFQLLFAASVTVAADLKVVASILPIHALVAGVMAGGAQPAVLVRSLASPHDYRLRPSDAARLKQADLVFWVGPELETFLVKPLSSLANRISRIALAGQPGIIRLQRRNLGRHADKHGAGTAPATDPHIWLDPRNAEAMVTAIAAHLAAANEAGRRRYLANAAALKQRLKSLDGDIARRLSAFHDRPYLVLHDGFQYFERRYGLRRATALKVLPEQRLGARRLRALTAQVRADRIKCIFTEPQFNPKLAHSLAGDLGLTVGVLDPIGSSIPPGPDAYFTLMKKLAGGYAACLVKRG